MSVPDRNDLSLFRTLTETKNQWARDDPAFIVIQAAFVAVSVTDLATRRSYSQLTFLHEQICSLAYAVAFRHPGFWGYLWSVIYILVVDWLLVGFAVASTCRYLLIQLPGFLWQRKFIVCTPSDPKFLLISRSTPSLRSHLANKYMRQYHSHSVEQDVEWLYAFDVHANAFFCSFLLTYVLQVWSRL